MGSKREPAPDTAPDDGEVFARMETMAREAAAREEVDELEAQERAGRFTNLIVLPNVPSEPFRSDLTIEQCNIFIASNHRTHFTRERTIEHPTTGEKVIRRVTIGKMDRGDRGRGVLTQMHQYVFYMLLKFWGEQEQHFKENEAGKKAGGFTTSAYKLVMYIFGNDKAASYQRLKRILADLAGIPITLENVYKWRRKFTEREHFTLLGEFYWREQVFDKKSKQPKRDEPSEVRILFSSFITKSFAYSNVKTLLMEPYRQLRGTGPRATIASLLFIFLDRQLSTKPEYRSKLAALAEEFDLPRHEYKKSRREQFAAAVRALNGKKIRAGAEDGCNYVLLVDLELAKDGSDWILRARRGDKLSPEKPQPRDPDGQLPLL